MHADKWITNALDVLGATGRDNSNLKERLAQRSGEPPRMAFVGPFDAGKSSLIKRLCVDQGVEPPTNLIISGEPSTTTVDEIQAGEWTLVDTPGLDTENEHHGRLARKAALESERTLLLVLPNLWTEGSETASLISELAPGTLDFVLSRADKPLVTPTADAIQSWAQQKEAELRIRSDALGHPDARVFVVSADPRGRVANREADRTRFDATRDWDGVATIEAILAEPCSPGLRTLAERRTVRLEVEEALIESHKALSEAERLQTEARDAVDLHDQRLTDLEAMQSQARAQLRDALELAARSGHPETAIPRITIAVDDWFTSTATDLKSVAREWQLDFEPWSINLASMITEPRVEPSTSDSAEDFNEWFDVGAEQARSRFEASTTMRDGHTADTQILNDYEKARREHRAREWYSGDQGANNLREVREARRRVNEDRIKAGLFRVGLDLIDWGMAERERRIQEENVVRREQAWRDAAVAKAAVIAGELFVGREDEGQRGAASLFNELSSQLDEQLEALRETASQAELKLVSETRAVEQLSALLDAFR